MDDRYFKNKYLQGEQYMQKNDILVTYGSNPKEMTIELCQAAKLENVIVEHCGTKICESIHVGLKPNLVLADTANNGATTHPEIAEGIIEYLHSKGFKNISIIEGSWIGGRTSQAFDVCGYNKLAKMYHVKLVDTQKDTDIECDCKGVKIHICESALAVDFMINIPVMKGHCQTNITCALKNNKGVIPNTEKRRFHTMGLHKPIAHLNTVAKNDFIIVDGICGDLTFEEGGNPVQMNRLIGTMDPVLCDTYVCDLLGRDIDEVPYIKMAEKLGVGSTDLSKSNIVELNKDKYSTNRLPVTNRIQELAKKTRSKDACSACYGSLIHALERMRENGSLNKVLEPICIGQGYKGGNGKLGIGNCTNNFEKCLKGCPPTAREIIRFLEEEK